MDWAVWQEEDPTLRGEIQYLCSHCRSVLHKACRIATLCESLELEQQAFYQSSNHLADANAHTCIYHCIQCDLNTSSSAFSKCAIGKAQWSIDKRVPRPVQGECDWCGKEGHDITTCYSIGYCGHCGRQGHGDSGCCRPHNLCKNGEYCQVYPTHPQFNHSWCHSNWLGINDDIPSDISFWLCIFGH